MPIAECHVGAIAVSASWTRETGNIGSKCCYIVGYGIDTFLIIKVVARRGVLIHDPNNPKLLFG